MNWFNERYDIIVRDRIRDAFKNQYYRKIEIWRLFGANVTLKVWEKLSGRRSVLYGFRNFINLIYLILLRDLIKYKKLEKNEINSNLKNLFVIEAISDESRIKGFWLPLARRFPENNTLLVTAKREVYEKYKSEINIHLLNKFYFGDWLFSRGQILKFVLNNFQLFFFNKTIKAPLSSVELINIFILQVDYIIRFQWLIKKYKPTGFLTIWDWYDIGSAGTAVFKSKGLPTFTLIHGAGGKEALKEMVPINSDYIISWGKINSGALIELGVREDKILECGCPRIPAFKTEFDYDITKEKYTILILLTAIIDTCFVKDIAELVKIYSDRFFINIRLHPSHKIEFLHSELRELKVQFITTIDETIDQSISNSDIIITDTSSAAFDVVNANKALFIIDSAPIPRPQDIANDLLSYDATVFCKSVSEFNKQLEYYLTNIEFRKKLANGRKSFIDYFVAASGDEATENIYKYISQKIDSKHTA